VVQPATWLEKWQGKSAEKLPNGKLADDRGPRFQGDLKNLRGKSGEKVPARGIWRKGSDGRGGVAVAKI